MAANGKKTKLKEPVKVRTKNLADGSESYYLDIYVDGKRQYEFLKLYRLPEINARVKEQNRATLAAVETIKSKRIIELTNNKAGLKNTSGRSKMLLSDWMALKTGTGSRHRRNEITPCYSTSICKTTVSRWSLRRWTNRIGHGETI